MEMKMGIYTRNNETCNFNFYTDLSAANKLKFVDSVVSVLVDDSHYNSIIRDLIFDFYVVSIMTDVDTTEFENSNNFLDDVEQFLEETNIVEIVKANAKTTLLNELNDAVDKSVQYLTGIHPSPLNESLANLFSTFEKKINEIDLSDMTEIAKKFSEITEDFSIENLVNAYMNTDTHKKNLKDIEEAKAARAEFAKDLNSAINAANNDVTNKK